jgi:hypothetical protein
LYRKVEGVAVRDGSEEGSGGGQTKELENGTGQTGKYYQREREGEIWCNAGEEVDGEHFGPL